MDSAAVLARHRKEKKDLQNQVTGLKKQASKKNRKQVNAKCEELSRELEERHARELAELEHEGGEQKADDAAEDGQVTPEELLAQLELEQPAAAAAPAPQAVASGRRGNRRKEKLARREAEVARIKAEAAAEAAEQPDLSKGEEALLQQLCSTAGLRAVDIQPDGHCLFASVLDQLRARHGERACEPYCLPQSYEGPRSAAEMDVWALRKLACCQVREHPDDFVPYLFDEQTLELQDVATYTAAIESSAKWGGEIELLALSQVFRCCISVLMAGRSTHRVNEQHAVNPELKLVYYKHSYALGEHYNSLRDAA
ncbi:ABR039Wp [Eremothecium gossypii ATCC 10895]|uniref:ABR039Wp n=1 Tax=Eremothecium gossypii (strain ATCC 10895 / CBS 109.51 / FGSC 9923 / NRRL Y-1056) TaxID=284811 RepID=Q75DS6_EREGS|nr:ABR039Wp [Eremothecium gossypii ATCC 10895]AAS50809.2 ABR039Wp [Eremothecium gossypii ATCC 10895]AEY95098.1 FABR039Wp [Eremothecium gossypii FDAG1]